MFYYEFSDIIYYFVTKALQMRIEYNLLLFSRNAINLIHCLSVYMERFKSGQKLLNHVFLYQKITVDSLFLYLKSTPPFKSPL